MTPSPQAHAELREKATSANSTPVARVRISGPEVLALLDRIAALEAQVADLDAPIVNARLALEKIKVLVKGEQDADEEEEFIIDIIEDWLTRYPQGAATKE